MKVLDQGKLLNLRWGISLLFFQSTGADIHTNTIGQHLNLT